MQQKELILDLIKRLHLNDSSGVFILKREEDISFKQKYTTLYFPFKNAFILEHEVSFYWLSLGKIQQIRL